MRILVWHVHGPWLAGLVQGDHDYLVPVLPDRGPDGRGRARGWDWPASVREVTPERLHAEDVDVVVLQRPHEIGLTRRWAGRVPGADVPAVYVEHEAPTGRAAHSVHPLADQDRIRIVHVTPYNAVMWDNGRAPTSVVLHGVPDPGPRWTGDIARAAVVSNHPVRRGRTVGTDLVLDLADRAPVDVLGVGTGDLVTHALLHGRSPDLHALDNLPQDRLHDALARRRCYVHLTRWTSLGLSLIEAMLLGMPIVAFASTESSLAVPEDAGLVSTRPERLWSGVRDYLLNPSLAAAHGEAARRHALATFGLARFLREWDEVLAEVMHPAPAGYRRS